MVEESHWVALWLTPPLLHANRSEEVFEESSAKLISGGDFSTITQSIP
ncbi:hypothetical protein [Leptospira ilyithenensis]|nr:hypothetical protein [Leptospira ilyithenensis]